MWCNDSDGDVVARDGVLPDLRLKGQKLWGEHGQICW